MARKTIAVNQHGGAIGRYGDHWADCGGFKILGRFEKAAQTLLPIRLQSAQQGVNQGFMAHNLAVVIQTLGGDNGL